MPISMFSYAHMLRQPSSVFLNVSHCHEDCQQAGVENALDIEDTVWESGMTTLKTQTGKVASRH